MSFIYEVNVRANYVTVVDGDGVPRDFEVMPDETYGHTIKMLSRIALESTWKTNSLIIGSGKF